MNDFFSYIRRQRKGLIESHGDAIRFCINLADSVSAYDLPEKVSRVLNEADSDERDYAIGSTYALLIGDERRKQLSAYFTPPALARAAIEAGSQFLDKIENPTVLDPACGGGSFVTPVVRLLAKKRLATATSRQAACSWAVNRVHGIELDPGLAKLSQHLLRKMLFREFEYCSDNSLKTIRCEDALTAELDQKFDLVIGNPPYGKIGNKVDTALLDNFGLANIGGHTNLYSLFLIRGLDWVRPGGGLVFVLPSSFIAGPYFSGLRQEISRRAEVLQIDLHEQRENLFLGAVQDVCLLTLQRRMHVEDRIENRSHHYKMGLISAAGIHIECGHAVAKGDGEPWTLPTASRIHAIELTNADSKAEKSKVFVLSDYGYRVRVGKVVPTRERDSLHDKRRAGDLPLVWASSIRPDGSFDFQASKRLGNCPWFAPPTDREVRYATTNPSVLVQRTSNRDQKRRLNAAAVPETFSVQHRKRGFVAENHVIIVEATSETPPVSPTMVAAILNSAVVNERFSTVCGSFSVSAKLLQRLALPSPDQLPKPNASKFEQLLRQTFSNVDQILAPVIKLETTRDLHHSIDQPCDLRSRKAVNEDTCLKRGTLARP